MKGSGVGRKVKEMQVWVGKARQGVGKQSKAREGQEQEGYVGLCRKVMARQWRGRQGSES